MVPRRAAGGTRCEASGIGSPVPYSALSHLDCPRCGARHDAGQVQGTCSCGSPLLARYDLNLVQAGPRDIAARPPDLWRYHELLPVREPGHVVSLGEGMTPLLALPALGQRLGVPNLLMKDEGLIPTGTFKARGAAVGVSRAAELGVSAIAMPTNGNAGAAWSAYAARAGMRSLIVMPLAAPAITRAECAAARAELYLVDGLIGDAGKLVAAAVGRRRRGRRMPPPEGRGLLGRLRLRPVSSPHRRDHGDGFDLDQLAGPAEHGHAEQRARRVVIAERRADDIPGRSQVSPFRRGDEHGGFEHVSQRGAGLGQGGGEIGHRQAGLRPHVTNADDFTPVVEGACSGGEDQRAARGGRRVRIGNTFVQAVRTYQVNCHSRTFQRGRAPHGQCWPLRKSPANVAAMTDMTARLEMISPSSRLSLSEVLEKFSDPMNTFPWAVPSSASMTFP